MSPHSLIFCEDEPTRRTDLTPYEVLFGSVPKTGLYLPQKVSALPSDLTSYVAAFQEKLTIVHKRVFSSIPDPESKEGVSSSSSRSLGSVKETCEKGSGTQTR